MTERWNTNRRWRSEQERQAIGAGCEGIRGRTGARAWEVAHIYTGSFTPPRTLPPLPPPDLDKEGRVDNQRHTPRNTRLTVQPIGATSMLANRRSWPIRFSTLQSGRQAGSAAAPLATAAIINSTGARRIIGRHHAHNGAAGSTAAGSLRAAQGARVGDNPADSRAPLPPPGAICSSAAPNSDPAGDHLCRLEPLQGIASGGKLTREIRDIAPTGPPSRRRDGAPLGAIRAAAVTARAGAAGQVGGYAGAAPTDGAVSALNKT